VWDTRENQRITEQHRPRIQMFLGSSAADPVRGRHGVATSCTVVKERRARSGEDGAGAKVRQVMSPFVLEALTMTILGGTLAPSSASD